MTQESDRESIPLDEMDRPPRASGLEMFLTWLGGFGGAMAMLFLCISLSDKPYGISVDTIVIDTAYVFFLVFCDSRAWHGYSLRNKSVRSQLPHLLAVHCVWLVVILLALTFALSIRPQLPRSWVVGSGRKDLPPYEGALVLLGGVIPFGQSWIYRRSLKRALEAEDANSSRHIARDANGRRHPAL